MNTQIGVVVLVTLLLVSPFVFYAIYSRRESAVRFLAVVTLIAVVPPMLAEHFSVLGSPLPASLAQMMPWKKPGHMQVLGSKVIVGDTIYLLLDNGDGTPVYLSLPFTKDLAEQLQQALDSGGAIFDGSGKGLGGAPTWNTKPQFLPVPPPPPLPPKMQQPQQQAPTVLDDHKST